MALQSKKLLVSFGIDLDDGRRHFSEAGS